jgi:MerT mercuric transport protein
MNKLVRTSTLSTAIFTAILPFFCCWGPTLLAGVAALSGAATKMAWLHPYEPWLYGVSFISIGYSHYAAYNSKVDTDNCNSCSVDTNEQLQKEKWKKIVLWGATILVIMLFTINKFPELINY